MPPEKKLYAWPDVSDIPPKTGIYAWYYRYMLTDFDIQKLTTDLTHMTGPTKKEDAEAAVSKFLQVHLFGPLVEEPYDTCMSGPLKPRYEGKLTCRSTISASLVERLAADPSRLVTLKKVLAEAVPEFASPIYIGMSVDLRSRIRRHKHLIETYKASDIGHAPNWDPDKSAEDNADHSFAWDVVRRGLSVNGLHVSIRSIAAPMNVHVDAENILNRINHPLCGRN